jgi:hypothetical protein
VTGVIQFDPKDGEAGGKKVRNITVRSSGFKENSIKVGATLWPSHAHVAVKKGDVVTLEGKFSRNTKTNAEGESVTYNNLSVTGIHVGGTLDYGEKVEVENETSATPDAEDDDIPF